MGAANPVVGSAEDFLGPRVPSSAASAHQWPLAGSRRHRSAWPIAQTTRVTMRNVGLVRHSPAARASRHEVFASVGMRRSFHRCRCHERRPGRVENCRCRRVAADSSDLRYGCLRRGARPGTLRVFQRARIEKGARQWHCAGLDRATASSTGRASGSSPLSGPTRSARGCRGGGTSDDPDAARPCVGRGLGLSSAWARLELGLSSA